MTPRPRAELAMAPDLPDRLFGKQARDALMAVFDVDFTRPLTSFDERIEADLLITGWECPRIDRRALDSAPRLRAICHAGGSVKGHVDPICWERGIVVSSAATANALPVAEYTLAMILLAVKGALPAARRYRELRGPLDQRAEFATVGAYQAPVGLVGASKIGRRVIELLRPFDLEVFVYDPFLSEDEAQRLGVRAASLAEVAAECAVLSVHAPALPSTFRLIDAEVLGAMPPGATLINTARGTLVDQDALVAELVSGRLNAILDVTEPEILPGDSPLYDLPNVLLTPHIAGALGNELHRLGDFAVSEGLRWLAGAPLAGEVTLPGLTHMA
jgi:phosphoglycerate dehydrogenase-like enzyme